jgi:hypothetical protein
MEGNIRIIITEKTIPISSPYLEDDDEDFFICKDCRLIAEPCSTTWCKAGECCCEGHTPLQEDD